MQEIDLYVPFALLGVIFFGMLYAIIRGIIDILP